MSKPARVVERFELGGVVGAALGIEIEQPRGPAEPVVRAGRAAELQLGLLLVVVLDVVRLRETERRAVAVVRPLVVVTAVGQNELRAHPVGELVRDDERNAARIHARFARIVLAVHDVGERRVVRVGVARDEAVVVVYRMP